MSLSWLDELNPAQREAVTHGEGPLLVVAGAGTGKTKTLACRVAYLIAQDVSPERILLLTFTRRAAAEMIRRAGQLCPAEASSKVWGGTFHAVANRLLRIYGRAVNLSPEFTVMDQSDAADMMNLIRSDLGVAKGDRRFPRKTTLVKIHSHTVNAQTHLGDVLDKHFPWCADDIEGIKAIFEQYTLGKREQSVLDYDDLLLHWSALCAAPRVGEAVGGRFEHVLVDEYQDTNALQAEILQGLRTNRKEIMVVGDDAQSIYSFRAATVQNILDFPKHFPGTRVVTLEENYRSTTPILAASNAVMEQASQRYTKELWSNRGSEQKPVLVTCLDESEQSHVVCDQIIEHLEGGTPLMHQAVLFRASYHSAQLEVELSSRNIPFHKYGGLKFIEAAHIKDMLAFLRILENPFDQLSWFRVLQLLPGVGPKSARRIIDALANPPPPPTPGKDDGEDASPRASPLASLFTAPPAVPPAARELFTELRQAFSRCCGVTIEASSKSPRPLKVQRAKEPPLSGQIELIRKFYEPICKERYENPLVRLRDIEQLEQIAAAYRSRNRFITDLTLDPPTSTADLAQSPFLEEDFLVLSTIHSAKGCEWTVVHIIHAADGMIPSDMALGDEAGLEEERRLLYVAMTRAKDHLYVHVPLRYYHRKQRFGDSHTYAQRSRFLTDRVQALFEKRTAGTVDEDMQLPVDSVVKWDVDERLNRLWRD